MREPVNHIERNYLVRFFYVLRRHGVAVGVDGEHSDAHEVAEAEDCDEDGEVEVVSAARGRGWVGNVNSGG